MAGFARLSQIRRRVLDALLASVVAQQQLHDCLANQEFPDDVFSKIRTDVDKLWTTSRKLDGRTLDEWNRIPPSDANPNRSGVYALGGALAGALGGAALATYAKRNTQVNPTTITASSDVKDLDEKIRVISEAGSLLRDYNHFYDAHRQNVKDQAIGALFDEVLASNQEKERLRAELDQARQTLETAAAHTLQIDMDWSARYDLLRNANVEIATHVERNAQLVNDQKILVDALANSHTRLIHVEVELAKERSERVELQAMLDRASRDSWTNDMDWETRFVQTKDTLMSAITTQQQVLTASQAALQQVTAELADANAIASRVLDANWPTDIEHRNLQQQYAQEKDALLNVLANQQYMLTSSQSALQHAQSELENARHVASLATAQNWQRDLELVSKVRDSEILMSDLVSTKQMLISTQNELMVKTNEQMQTDEALRRASMQLWFDTVESAQAKTTLLQTVSGLMHSLVSTSQMHEAAPNVLPEALQLAWVADMNRQAAEPQPAAMDVDDPEKDTLLSALGEAVTQLVSKGNQLQTTNDELATLQRIIANALPDVWKSELDRGLTAEVVNALLPTLIACHNKTQFLGVDSAPNSALSEVWKTDIDNSRLGHCQADNAQLISNLADRQRAILELTQNNELWEAKVGMIETQRNNALDSKLACALELDKEKSRQSMLQAQNAALDQQVQTTAARLATAEQESASLLTELAGRQKSLLQAMSDQSLCEAAHDQTKARLENALDAVLACKLDQDAVKDALASVMTRLLESESARQKCDQDALTLAANLQTASEKALVLDMELQALNNQPDDEKIRKKRRQEKFDK
jgi:hypothetical protein